jgi:hypothetical protein
MSRWSIPLVVAVAGAVTVVAGLASVLDPAMYAWLGQESPLEVRATVTMLVSSGWGLVAGYAFLWMISGFIRAMARPSIRQSTPAPDESI